MQLLLENSKLKKGHNYRIYPKYSDRLKELFLLLYEHLIWKIYFFSVGIFTNAENYQSSRVFTGIYATTFPYIPIGVKTIC